MALQLEFRYRDDEPWIVVRQAFDIINDYLQPHSPLSAAETADRIDDLTPAKRTLTDGECVEGSDSFLLEFWEVFVATVKQIPHSHEAQERMLNLTEKLEGLPTPSSEDGGRMWAGLQYLQNTLDEQTREPTDQEDTYAPFREWVNLHSFIARIYGRDLLNGLRDAVRTLRDAFENDRSTDKDVQDCRIAAAAQYGIYCSAQLLEVMRNKSSSEGERRALSSSKFDKDTTFSVDRWDFWKEQFQRIAEENEEASNALQQMRAAEQV